MKPPQVLLIITSPDGESVSEIPCDTYDQATEQALEWLYQGWSVQIPHYLVPSGEK